MSNSGTRLAIPPPRARSLVSRLQWVLAILLLGPLNRHRRARLPGLVGAGTLNTRRDPPGASAGRARQASEEVVKSSLLDRVSSVGAELDLVLKLDDMAQLASVLEQARVGRAGSFILIGSDNKVKWDIDNDTLGRPLPEVIRRWAALLGGASWRAFRSCCSPRTAPSCATIGWRR